MFIAVHCDGVHCRDGVNCALGVLYIGSAIVGCTYLVTCRMSASVAMSYLLKGSPVDTGTL